MRQQITVPRYADAAAILRKTTERLAREVAEPTITPPDWNQTEWIIARAATAMQGIGALLADRLRWSGPEHWQSYIEDQRCQARLRHASAGRLLERLDEAFAEAGCTALALKGSAVRKLGIYSDGQRPMGDVDLLVEPEAVAACVSALRKLGYSLIQAKDRHDVFAPGPASLVNPLGEHVDNPLKVELHTRIAEALPIREIDITAYLRGAQAYPGLNTYPSLATLLLHLMLHAAGNMRAHAARQIQFNDIARIAPLLDASDWQEALLEAASGECRWWAYPPLAMTNRYYRDAIPSSVIDDARRACPRALRRWVERRTLTDISWSNLRIHAFPGLAWSRSPRDALRFVRSRVIPRRSALRELQEGFTREQRLQQIPWYELSHLNRIIRWVFSRPPRVQAMHAISAQIEHVNSTEPH